MTGPRLNGRKRLLDFLVTERAIAEELCTRILAWRHGGGFSAHNQVRVGADDREGRMKLAGIVLLALGVVAITLRR